MTVAQLIVRLKEIEDKSRIIMEADVVVIVLQDIVASGRTPLRLNQESGLVCRQKEST